MRRLRRGTQPQPAPGTSRSPEEPSGLGPPMVQGGRGGEGGGKRPGFLSKLLLPFKQKGNNLKKQKGCARGTRPRTGCRSHTFLPGRSTTCHTKRISSLSSEPSLAPYAPAVAPNNTTKESLREAVMTTGGKQLQSKAEVKKKEEKKEKKKTHKQTKKKKRNNKKIPQRFTPYLQVIKGERRERGVTILKGEERAT